MLLLAVASVVTGVGAWRLVRAIGFADRLVRWIAFLAVVPVQIALLVLGVGAVLHALRPGALCLAAAAVAALEVLVCRPGSSRETGSHALDRGGRGLGSARAGLARRGRRDGRRARRGSRRRAPRPTWSPAARWSGRGGLLLGDLLVGALALVVGFQYAWQAVRTVILPTNGYDALTYHLISPSIWVQQGVVGRTGVGVFSDSYPQGQELVHAWTMTFLHSLRGTGMVVIWFAALGALCVAWLARSLGASPRLSVVSALLFLGMPAVFLQVSANYVDVAGASCALATLVLLQARPRTVDPGGPPRWAVLTLVGAVVGLAVAVKASNLVLVPLVLAMVAADGALFVRDASRPLPGTDFRIGRELGLMSVPMFAVGSWWYVRNLLEHDNPFFPVTMLGFEGLGRFDVLVVGANRPEEVASAPFGPVGGILRSWVEDLSRHPFLYDQRLGGLGAVWLLACLPCLAYVVWRLWSSHRTLVLSVVLPAVAVALASQAAWWARYSFTLAAVGCAAVGVVLQHLAEQRDRLVPLGLAWVLVLTAGTAWSATFPQDYRLTGAVAVGGPVDLWRLASDPARVDQIYPYDAYPGRDEVPDGATIAILGADAEVFPQILVGNDLERRLVVLDRPQTEPELRRQLEERGARYVSVPPAASDADLGAQLARATRSYRPVVAPGAFGGSQLWELGTFEPCEPPVIELDVVRRADRERLIGAVERGCRPADPVAIEIWRGPSSGDVWADAVVVAVTSTDARGRFELDLPSNGSPGDRYFARFGGGWRGRSSVPASASSPVATS